MQNLGNKIRILREVKGLTQEQMATQLDMTQAGYSKLERNETDMPVSRLEQICSVLEISPADMLALEDRFVFHNIQSTVGANVNNGSLQLNERKEYEDRIALLEELLAAYRSKATS